MHVSFYQISCEKPAACLITGTPVWYTSSVSLVDKMMSPSLNQLHTLVCTKFVFCCVHLAVDAATLTRLGIRSHGGIFKRQIVWRNNCFLSALLNLKTKLSFRIIVWNGYICKPSSLKVPTLQILINNSSIHWWWSSILFDWIPWILYVRHSISILHSFNDICVLPFHLPSASRGTVSLVT